MEPSTLHNQKSTFLTQQIRLLSSPLQPTPQFTSTLPQPSKSASTASTNSTARLTTKTIDDLVSKVNDKIKSHNKLVFSAQSQRHIVAQIESLYFNEALDDTSHTPDRDADGEYEGDELVTISRDVDLTSTALLQSLPEELQQAMLSDVSDFGMDEEHAERYTLLRAQLLELAEQRDAAREKLEGYRRLEGLLRPFENPQSSVQPNLVTKDGEMSRELERMRVLLARVTGRLGEVDGMFEGTEGGRQRHSGGTFDEKLSKALEGVAG